MRSIEHDAIVRLLAAEDVPQVQSSERAWVELVVTVMGLAVTLIMV